LTRNAHAADLGKMSHELEPADVVSEETARAVWRRAAQLQAEAAQRLEERSLRFAGESTTEKGFKLTEVEAAATEAGISLEFVRLAITELSGQDEGWNDVPRWMDRGATHLLGTSRRRVEVTRLIAATPAEVLNAMKRVFPSEPYLLTLRETRGEHPLSGGILIFDVPPHHSSKPNMFALGMAYAGLKHVHVAIRVAPRRDREACELIVTGDLRNGIRTNWWLGSTSVGIGSGAGLAAGGAAGATIASALGAGALMATGVIGIAAVGVGLAVGKLVAAGYGGAYHWGVRKGVAALEDLLRAVDRAARGDDAFAFPAPGSPAPAADRGAIVG
jgi:hypothetical protein